MTVSQIISQADAIRPNSIPEATKRQFLADIEGQVLVLVAGKAPEDTAPLTDADGGKVLTAPFPFDRLYLHYLCAMYAWHAGDAELYTNDRVVFEAAWSDYAKWYVRAKGGTRHGSI